MNFKNFNTQDLKELIDNSDEPRIAFACFKCGCNEGVMIFDSKTQTELLGISYESDISTQEVYEKLRKLRNKLNRQISTLKKVTIEN